MEGIRPMDGKKRRQREVRNCVWLAKRFHFGTLSRHVGQSTQVSEAKSDYRRWVIELGQVIKTVMLGT